MLDHDPITDGSTCATKWRSMHGHSGGLLVYKKRIDASSMDDFIWTPYVDRIVHQKFDDISFFRVLCDGRVLWLHI